MAKYLKINGKRQTKFDLMYLIKRIDSLNACGVYSSYKYEAYVHTLRWLVTVRGALVQRRTSIALYEQLCDIFDVVPKYE